MVVVPELETNTAGTNWARKSKTIPLTDFYVAQEKDTAATINAALAQGKNLLITPGIYHLDDSLKVTKAERSSWGWGTRRCFRREARRRLRWRTWTA